MSGTGFPDRCEDIRHFNAELVSWLARTGPGELLGESHDAIVTTVPIGDDVCQLRGGSTREGIVAFLERALAGKSAFVVVPSKSAVMHRISIGDANVRIRGFYLYASEVHHRSEVIADADGTAFGWEDRCFKLLDAIAYLHSQGHQRLRVLPNVNDMGSWQAHVFLSEHVAMADGFPYGSLDSRVFGFSRGVFRIGDIEVGPYTPVRILARAILEEATDPGLGIDWAYAGWFAEMLDAAHRLRGLPIDYMMFGKFPYQSSWELGPGTGVAFPLPPPPVSGTRIGFSDVFPVPPAEQWDVPVPTGRIPIDLDPTKMREFSGLVAGFDGAGGEFVGLWAMVGKKYYHRIDGRWLPYVDSVIVARSTRVPVSYRFIKSFDILAAIKQEPDWSFAQSMRVFISPLTEIEGD